MACVLRRAVATIVAVLVVGWILVGCGSSTAGESGAVGTSGGNAAAFVSVEVTPSLAIAIRNRGTNPLFDVNVAIRPSSGSIVYSATVPRLEGSEQRSLPFGGFRSADGKPFSAVLGFVRPKEIAVTATDGGGAKHEMTVPWES